MTRTIPHLLVCAALVFGACGKASDGPSDSNTNWLSCSADIDCATVAGAICGSEGYCVDAGGNRVDGVDGGADSASAAGAGGTDAGGTGAGGAGGGGAGAGGAMDCSLVGCGAPPLCSTGCQEPCGCCSCGDGDQQIIGGTQHVCEGGCWAPSGDGGASGAAAGDAGGDALGQPEGEAGAPGADDGGADATAADSGVDAGGVDCSLVGCGAPPLCSAGCTAPCGCCACAEGALDESGIISLRCTNGCWAPVCSTDDDCPSTEWCRTTSAGDRACAPYAVEGDFCAGFTPEWAVQRCSPELVCTDTQPTMVDGPGRCREACSSDSECPANRYCSTNNDVCRDDGDCFDSFDCDAAGNLYAGVTCSGYGTCSAGACTWECGDAQCRDLTGTFFGVCSAVLGWGVQGSECVSISGCDPRGHGFFGSETECVAACLG